MASDYSANSISPHRRAAPSTVHRPVQSVRELWEARCGFAVWAPNAPPFAWPGDWNGGIRRRIRWFFMESGVGPRLCPSRIMRPLQVLLEERRIAPSAVPTPMARRTSAPSARVVVEIHITVGPTTNGCRPFSVDPVRRPLRIYEAQLGRGSSGRATASSGSNSVPTSRLGFTHVGCCRSPSILRPSLG